MGMKVLDSRSSLWKNKKKTRKEIQDSMFEFEMYLIAEKLKEQKEKLKEK
jgi:hypothetical protein